jgi:Inner membrane protein YgaP-like, transmembrane domain
MGCNVGGADRAVRIVGGLFLLVAAYLWLAGALSILAYVVGAIALVTGLIRFCPINRLLGIDTCGESSA